MLPLFVHTPSVPADSVTVLLGAGDYKVLTDKKDAILNLSIPSNEPGLFENIQDGQLISVKSKSPARASIVVAGKESHISLYLNAITHDLKV